MSGKPLLGILPAQTCLQTTCPPFRYTSPHPPPPPHLSNDVIISVLMMIMLTHEVILVDDRPHPSAPRQWEQDLIHEQSPGLALAVAACGCMGGQNWRLMWLHVAAVGDRTANSSLAAQC